MWIRLSWRRIWRIWIRSNSRRRIRLSRSRRSWWVLWILEGNKFCFNLCFLLLFWWFILLLIICMSSLLWMDRSWFLTIWDLFLRDLLLLSLWCCFRWITFILMNLGLILLLKNIRDRFMIMIMRLKLTFSKVILQLLMNINNFLQI